MSPPRGVLAAEVAWPEVERRLAEGAVAVLPVGAAAKEHGYHLPLGADALQAEWLGARVAERCNAVVWPVLGYGHYPAFVDYPGSISIAAATFVATVVDILAGFERAGAVRSAVLNTGISTIAPLAEACADARLQRPARLVNVYDGARFTAVRRQVEEQAWGGHADEIETSLVLAIAPQLVAMAHAEPSPMRIERGPFNRSDPAARNYTPSGVNGDPRLATRAKGERLLAALLEDVLEALA